MFEHETIAIFGVGLIGGSFALALKRTGFGGRIIGVSSPATLDAARRLGVIDDAMPADQAAAIADFCYLALPIAKILEILPVLNSWVRPETLVTDAGSTKGSIVACADASLTRCQFLGGHPLAGKEVRGVENADPDLFRGRTYILTPRRDEDLLTPSAVRFRDLLERIGTRPHVTTPERHDAVVAYTSHLPQLISTALAACLGREFPGPPPIWGPALVDSTRLALSPFDIWRDILATNTAAIDAAMKTYIARIEEVRAQLASPHMKDVFQGAARMAQSLRDPG